MRANLADPAEAADRQFEREVVGARCCQCPLTRIRAGMAARIKRLPDSPEVATRLREIGLLEERIIRLVAFQTNVICLVCNARLALSERLAECIMVEPIPVAAASAYSKS